ncbi:MAG: TPM domain-containing protein, partial [Oscillospiraceae bacterium]|nr:TPM domain-containing protein [Oscillospiraceae bacterium]
MKTKRTLLLAIAAIFTVLLFLPVLSVPAKAAAEYVFDDAGLLTVEERGTLSETLQFVSEEHNLDVIVITFDMAEGGDPAEHAADLYEANGIGVGDHENAIIFDLRVNGEEGGFGHVT